MKLVQLEDMFRYQSYGAVVEMAIAAFEGQRVLAGGPLVLRAGQLGGDTEHVEMIFGAIDVESLRKWSFQFDTIWVPKLTQIRRAVMTWLGYELHPGGTIVYGQPFVPK